MLDNNEDTEVRQVILQLCDDILKPPAQQPIAEKVKSPRPGTPNRKKRSKSPKTPKPKKEKAKLEITQRYNSATNKLRFTLPLSLEIAESFKGDFIRDALRDKIDK